MVEPKELGKCKLLSGSVFDVFISPLAWDHYFYKSILTKFWMVGWTIFLIGIGWWFLLLIVVAPFFFMDIDLRYKVEDDKSVMGAHLKEDEIKKV